MRLKVSQTIAAALLDLGVDVVTHVPGFGGSETFQAYVEQSMKRLRFSFHEEAAYSIAHGASICGKRSAVMIKAHGFLKAMNSISDSLYSEISAGLVVFVFEDLSGKSSDTILEIAPVLDGVSMPFFNSQSSTLYNDVINAFNESEKRKTPVALLINAAEINDEINSEQKSGLKKTFAYQRDVLKHVVHPLLSDYQYKVFISKKLNGESATINPVTLPIIPDQLTGNTKAAVANYLPLFTVFKNYRGDVVTGDTSSLSSFSFPPFNCIDIVTYMGGSIPLAIGAYLAGYKNVWALTGDFGFISAGSIGMIEVLQREIPIKIMIFYNKKAAATGGQIIDKKIMRHLLAGYERFIVHISNPMDPFEIESVLKNVSSLNETKIVLVDYPD